MTFVEQGYQGAFRQSWRKNNPRLTLRSIIIHNHGLSEADIHKLFWTEIQDDSELVRACVEYWLDNNYHSLTRELRPQSKRSKALNKGAAETAKEIIANNINERARLVLLDWIMPNQKRLGDCNAKDCLKIGGWLTVVGKQLPAGKIVSEVFSEKRLYALYR